MNTTDCFSEIKTKGKDLILHLEYLISLKNLAWQEHFGFQAVQIDITWVKKEPALKQIDEIHPIKQLGLLKVPKKSFYNWHVDDFRQSCINLLISKEHNSYSIFGEHQNDYYYKNIIELNYEPSTYYLFNNQKSHAVFNMDSEDRYLFSLYYKNEQPYEIMCKKLRRFLISH